MNQPCGLARGAGQLGSWQARIGTGPVTAFALLPGLSAFITMAAMIKAVLAGHQYMLSDRDHERSLDAAVVRMCYALIGAFTAGPITGLTNGWSRHDLVVGIGVAPFARLPRQFVLSGNYVPEVLASYSA